METQAAMFASGALLAGVLVKGVLLLAGAAVVTFVLRRRTSAATRHAIWHLAFLGLLLLPLGAAFGPGFDVPGLSLASASPSPAVEAAAPKAPVPATTMHTTSAGNIPAAALPIASAPADDASPPAWLTALLLVWALGAGVLLGRLVYGLIQVARLGWRAHRLDEPAWNALGRQIEDQLGLRRKVSLLQHADVEMPMTFGIRRPVILLPAAAKDWPVEKRRLVLLHELAHVRRGDALMQLIMQFAYALHWPNPLAWFGARRFLLAREQACDDRVLAAGARPSDYASQLVEVARGLKARPHFAATPSMAAPSELKNRIQSILDERRLRRGLSRPGACALAVLALAIVLPLAALRPATAEIGDIAAPQTAPPAPATIGDTAKMHAATRARAAKMQAAAAKRQTAARAAARAEAKKQAAEAKKQAIEAERRAAAQADASHARAQARDAAALKRAEARLQAVEHREQAREQAAKQREKAVEQSEQARKQAMVQREQTMERRKQALEQHKQAMERLKQAMEQRKRVMEQRKQAMKQREQAMEQRKDTAERSAAAKRRADDRAGIQQAAIAALAQLSPELPPKKSVPILAKIAKSSANPAVRGQAIVSLGRIGRKNKKVAQFLINFAEQHAKTPGLQQYLIGAIGQLPPNQQSVPLLIQLAKSGSSADIRENAILLLGRTHDPRAAKAVIDIVEGTQDKPH
jgi:beta-lactamase regulating signal transducer with metallopeptidase domain